MNINNGRWTKTTDRIANTATWERTWTIDKKLFANVIVTTFYELRRVNSYVDSEMAVPDTEITITMHANAVPEIIRQMDFHETEAMQKISCHIDELIKEYADGQLHERATESI